MPIFIKHFDWDQNENSLYIKLNIPGVRKNNLSIISSSKFIKINRSPYLWEAFLRHEIKPESCNVLIGENIIEIRFEKDKIIHWDALLDENCKTKEYQNEMRQNALQEIANRYQNYQRHKEEKKLEVKNFLTEEIIKKEEKMRIEVENEKRAERKKIDNEMERFKEGSADVPRNQSKTKLIPEPRAPGKIAVTFTPRPFSSAARESMLEKESQMLNPTTSSK